MLILPSKIKSKGAYRTLLNDGRWLLNSEYTLATFQCQCGRLGNNENELEIVKAHGLCVKCVKYVGTDMFHKVCRPINSPWLLNAYQWHGQLLCTFSVYRFLATLLPLELVLAVQRLNEPKYDSLLRSKYDCPKVSLV